MAAESNTGFQYQSAFNRHAVSFQTGAINSTSEMIPMGTYYGRNTSNAGGVMFSANSGIHGGSPGISPTGSSSGSLLLESVPGLKHDTGLAVEWSVEEQYKLEEGLVKYVDETSIMKYIKIAATLRDKTVRDVALRCRWMTRKRRKQDDLNLGKKVKDRKDKSAELSSRVNVSSASPLNLAAYSVIRNQREQRDHMPFEELIGTTRHLLDQNCQVLGQISANLSALKLHDNIDLFYRARNNITAILNVGIMSQMPPLPVSVNDELVNSILPSTAQTMMFGSSSGIHLKQEPGC